MNLKAIACVALFAMSGHTLAADRYKNVSWDKKAGTITFSDGDHNPRYRLQKPVMVCNKDGCKEK